MTDNSQAIATQPTSQEQSLPQLDRVNELFGVLAPIRAIGMSDDMASDWSAVIISECRDLTDAQFLAGCANAKRECSDHRGVLKAILAGAREAKPDFAARFANEWNAAVQGQAPPRLTGPQSIGKLTEGYID